jgi:TetR/AcrR family transcriptional regulator, mexCD-oprJ operon repressor
MPPARTDSPHSPPRRRADAERSIARILDAAVDALANDPEASMAEVARRAGVVRATIYVHFPTREALIEAVTHRAIAEATAILEAAEPDRGDAAGALRRVVESAWRTLGRYHALVAINIRLAPADLRRRHEPVLAVLEPLIEAVTDRAIAEATAILEAAEPDRGDAAGALRRVVESAWRTLGRYHALVAISTRLAPADLRRRHEPVLAVLEPLIERGQRDGAFRADVPAAWHLSMILALIHAASGELSAGRLPSRQVESALVGSVLGAVSAAPPR